jgi:hypothetical protein
MTPRLSRILTFLLAALLMLSAFLNVYLLGVLVPRQESEISGLAGQYGYLQVLDAEHRQQIARDNATILQYSRDLEENIRKLGEVASTLNTTLGAYRGSASLEAPVIVQRTGSGSTGESVREEGDMMNVSVEVRAGKGRVLVETRPLLGFTFQETATSAVTAARRFTGSDLSLNDVVFTMKSREKTKSIDGSSAGALMSILLVSVLDGRSIDQNVTITGAVEPGGRIGPVDGIVEKAHAAKANGKTLFLVPRENQELIVVTGSLFYGQRETMDAKAYIESVIGIRTEYVDSIADLPKLMYT